MGKYSRELTNKLDNSEKTLTLRGLLDLIKILFIIIPVHVTKTRKLITAKIMLWM